MGGKKSSFTLRIRWSFHTIIPLSRLLQNRWNAEEIQDLVASFSSAKAVAAFYLPVRRELGQVPAVWLASTPAVVAVEEELGVECPHFLIPPPNQAFVRDAHLPQKVQEANSWLSGQNW